MSTVQRHVHLIAHSNDPRGSACAVTSADSAKLHAKHRQAAAVQAKLARVLHPISDAPRGAFSRGHLRSTCMALAPFIHIQNNRVNPRLTCTKWGAQSPASVRERHLIARQVSWRRCGFWSNSIQCRGTRDAMVLEVIRSLADTLFPGTSSSSSTSQRHADEAALASFLKLRGAELKDLPPSVR